LCNLFNSGAGALAERAARQLGLSGFSLRVRACVCVARWAQAALGAAAAAAAATTQVAERAQVMPVRRRRA